MTLDEQVTHWADGIGAELATIRQTLAQFKTRALGPDAASEARAAAIASLGRIKATTLRAHRAGLQDRLAAELKRRGYGAQ